MKIKLNNKTHDVIIGTYALSLFEDAENVEFLSGKIPLKLGLVIKVVYYALIAQGVECEMKDVFAAFDKDKTLFEKGGTLLSKTIEGLSAIEGDAKK